MRCTDNQRITEVDLFTDFFNVTDRHKCAGPRIGRRINIEFAELLNDCVLDQRVRDQLADNIFDMPDADPLDLYADVVGELCALHWLEAACALGEGGEILHDDLAVQVAIQLISHTCDAAGWDMKEILNLCQWQRTRFEAS